MTMPETLKAVVVGCRRGRSHAVPISELDEFELIGLCDLSKESAEELADETGNPPTFTEYDEMLARTDPDIVAVAVPTALHCQYVLKALEKGVRGIVCEKPVARDLGEANEMVQACRARGVPLIFQHQRRLSDPYLTMRRLIAESAVGELQLIRVSCAGQVITDGTHSVDLIFHLAGDPVPEWVFGQIHRLRPDPNEARSQGGKPSGGYRYGHPIEDGAVAVIQFSGGVRAELLCGDMRLPGRGYQDVEVFGTEGRLWRASDRAEIPLQRQDASGGWREAPLDRTEFGTEDADTRSYKLFAETVMNGAIHPLNSDTALSTFQVLMGIYESARLNARVEMPVDQKQFPLALMIAQGRA
jgi:UDP-N-acetyl-2-amino-2-deoxyglucuronate dehydrogenase